MLRVGLTGGIASGKTAVANVFSDLGAGVIDTDHLAREVVAPGEPGLGAVREAFGNCVISNSGKLDRRALRTLVFANPEDRRRLEAILHPLIRRRTSEKLDQLDAPYALVVVPLLFETGFETLVDRVAVVDCPRDVQLKRLRARDGIDKAEAEAMLSAQANRETRLARADDVIDSSGDWERTRERVRELDAQYSVLIKG